MMLYAILTCMDFRVFSHIESFFPDTQKREDARAVHLVEYNVQKPAVSGLSSHLIWSKIPCLGENFNNLDTSKAVSKASLKILIFLTLSPTIGIKIAPGSSEQIFVKPLLKCLFLYTLSF